MNRRQLLQLLAALAAAPSNAAPSKPTMLARPIPKSGEALPVIGLGTWQTFDVADAASVAPVVEALLAAGARLIDSSPMYGRAEQVTGDVLDKLAAIGKPFLATKVWTQGKQAGIISRALEGQAVGTYFPAAECHRSRREKWILAGKSHGRRVQLDGGASDALVVKKKSLLAAGVKEVEGNFQPMDVVEIAGPQGQILGKGIINYSATELRRIMGHKSSEIETILGGKTYEGERLTVTITDSLMQQEVFAFRAAGRTYLLVIQDSLTPDMKTSAELAKTVEILKRSFRVFE